MEAVIKIQDIPEGSVYPRNFLCMGDIQGHGHYGYEHSGKHKTRELGMYWMLNIPLPGRITVFDACADRYLRGKRFLRLFLAHEFAPGWMVYPQWRFRSLMWVRNPEVIDERPD